jgi:hypothetical protein
MLVALVMAACGESKSDGDSELGASADRLRIASEYCGRSIICHPAEGIVNPSNSDDLYNCLSSFFDDDELSASSGRLEALDAVADCAKNAGDCTAFAECETQYREAPRPTSPRAGQVCGEVGDESVSCDGNVVLWCFGGEYDTPQNIPFDCGARGHVCDAAAGFCVDRDAAPCEEGTEKRCDGDAIVSCVGGKTLTSDCTAFSSSHTCVEDGDGGEVGCSLRANAPGCPAPGSAESVDGCDGSVLFHCRDGGRFEFDCASFQGYRCEPGGEASTLSRCVAP